MNNVRESDWWWLMREIRQRGSLDPLRDRWALSKILKKSPVQTRVPGGGAQTGVHHLCYKRDWKMALWALKSFYWCSGVDYPLTVHFQSEMPQQASDAFRSHFPQARLIPIREADDQMDRYFRAESLEKCRELRPQLGLHIKMFDFQVLGSEPQILAFDPDVLFFRRPDELLALAEGGVEGFWAQKDMSNCYGRFTAENIFQRLGIRLVPEVNTGIVLRRRSDFDFHQLEEWLKVPGTENPSGHAEQAWQAVLASAKGSVRFWPESYMLSNEPVTDPEKTICRHYAGYLKEKFVPEGIPLLQQNLKRRQSF